MFNIPTNERLGGVWNWRRVLSFSVYFVRGFRNIFCGELKTHVSCDKFVLIVIIWDIVKLDTWRQFWTFHFKKWNDVKRAVKLKQKIIRKKVVVLPVMWASSTISAPNTENAFTNSVKVATDSNLPNVLDICKGNTAR